VLGGRPKAPVRPAKENWIVRGAGALGAVTGTTASVASGTAAGAAAQQLPMHVQHG